MRRLFGFVLRASFACAALIVLSPIVAVLHSAEIPKGTHVLLRLENSVTTRTAQPGDVIYLRTVSPIIIDNRIVVPPGSYAQASVSLARRGGRVSGQAELGLRLDTLSLASGRTFQISGTVASADAEGTGQQARKEEGVIRQSPEKGRDAGTVAIRSGEGAALGAIIDRSAEGAGIGGGAGAAAGLAQILLTRGRDVELRRGATIDIALDRPLSTN